MPADADATLPVMEFEDPNLEHSVDKQGRSRYFRGIISS